MCMFRAAMSPASPHKLVELVGSVMSSTKGEFGLAFEGVTIGEEHVTIRSGGVEAEWKHADRAPTHVLSDGRWSFPATKTCIKAMLLKIDIAMRRDYAEDIVLQHAFE